MKKYLSLVLGLLFMVGTLASCDDDDDDDKGSKEVAVVDLIRGQWETMTIEDGIENGNVYVWFCVLDFQSDGEGYNYSQEIKCTVKDGKVKESDIPKFPGGYDKAAMKWSLLDGEKLVVIVGNETTECDYKVSKDMLKVSYRDNGKTYTEYYTRRK